MKKLILVDYQNEWISPKSEYYVGDISGVIKNTNKLIDWARKNNIEIIFTIHEELDSKTEFAPNSHQTEIIETLKKQENDTFIRKNYISPFYKTNLENELTDTDEIIVAGILSNLCVRSLVSDAYDRDFAITVVTDCCASFDEETQSFTFQDLKTTRPEVEFVTLSEFIK